MKKLLFVFSAIIFALALTPAANARSPAYARPHGGARVWLGGPGYVPYYGGGYYYAPGCCYSVPNIIVPAPVYEAPAYTPAPPALETTTVPDDNARYFDGAQYITPYVTVTIYRDASGRPYYSLHGVSHWLR